MRMKTWGLLALKIALSGALIWYFVGKSDLGAAMEDLRRVDVMTVVLAIVLFLVQMALVAWRWSVLMRLVGIGDGLSFHRIVRTVWIATFFNTTLVSSVGGDAFRLWTIVRWGNPLGKSVNSIFLDRLAAAMALMVLIAVSLPYVMELVTDETAILSYALLIAASLAGFTALLYADRMPRRIQHWRLVRGLANLAADTRRLTLHMDNLLPVVALSLLVHVLSIIVVYVLAGGLEIGISFLDCFFLVPPVIIAMTLPISIAGWGVREGVMIVAMGLMGVSQESALVLSILFGLGITLAALPGGVIWLFSRNRAVPAMPGGGAEG
jgi:uncharacterized protein (TIRG00374 family)